MLANDLADRPELRDELRELGLAARFGEVIRICDRHLQEDGTDVALLGVRSAARAWQDDHAGSLADAERIIELEPQHLTAHIRRATALSEMHRHSDAAAAREQALALTEARLDEVPRDADAWQCRAALLLEMKRPAEALEAADEALQAGAEQESVSIGRALTYANLGDAERAKEAIGEVVQARPDAALYRVRHAGVLMILGEYSAAEAAASKAIELNRRSGTSWQVRAWQRVYQGRRVEGARDLERATRLLPDSPSAHADRAIVLYSLAYAYWDATTVWERIRGWWDYQRFSQAFSQEAERVLELDPHHARVRQLLGVVRMAEGREREAKDHIRVAVNVHSDRLSVTPDDPWELLERGWCHLCLDETYAARKDFDEVIEIDQNGASATQAHEYLRGMDGSPGAAGAPVPDWRR